MHMLHTRKPGELLAEMGLPNLREDPLCGVMMKWRQLVSDFESPEDDAHGQVKAFFKYYQDLENMAKIPSTGTTDDASEVVGLIATIRTSWSSIVTLKGMGLITKNPKEAWDVDKMLLKSWQPMASAVIKASSMEEEMAPFKAGEADLKVLASKLTTFEMSAAVCHDFSKGKDLELIESQKLCISFNKIYTETLDKVLAEMHDSGIAEIASFVEKFSKVKEAASTWSMEPFRWVYEGDDTKQDFKRLHAAMTTVQDCLGDLTPFGKHSPGHVAVKESLKSVEDWVCLAKRTLRVGREVAGTLMVSGFFLNPEADMSIENIMKHCFTMYGMKAEHLTGKIQKMASKALEDAVKSNKDSTKKRKSTSSPPDASPPSAATNKKVKLETDEEDAGEDDEEDQKKKGKEKKEKSAKSDVKGKKGSDLKDTKDTKEKKVKKDKKEKKESKEKKAKDKKNKKAD